MKGVHDNYIPYRIIEPDETIKVTWLNSYRVPYTDPFFDETILKCITLNKELYYYKSVSSLDFMSELDTGFDKVPVSAFIFHVSRCGSTMLSQLLGLDEENIVLAEVPLFDEILRNKRMTKNEKKKHLQSALQWYGQNRNGVSKQLYVKLDSWLVYYWRLIREIWPEVPFFLLIRDPTEVCFSHLKQPGRHAVPGLLEPFLFGMKDEDVEVIGNEAYLNKVLDYFFQEFRNMLDTDNNCILLNYHLGIRNALEIILHVNGTTPDDLFLQKIENRMKFHSKDNARVFQEILPSKDITSVFKEALASFRALSVLTQSLR